MGNQVGSMTGNLNIGSPNLPPPLPNTQYFLAINGHQQGPYDLNTVTAFIQNHNIVKDTLVWKLGMPNWDKMESLPEFAHFFLSPPPLPNI